MRSEVDRWVPFNADAAAVVPDGPGVFEVANLVRNILYIGCADGSLRTRLNSLFQPGNPLPSAPGGYYVRYEQTANEAEAFAHRMMSYRSGHAGRVPPGNREQREHRPPVVRLAVCQAA
jgi:hypothetical protein